MSTARLLPVLLLALTAPALLAADAIEAVNNRSKGRKNSADQASTVDLRLSGGLTAGGFYDGRLMLVGGEFGNTVPGFGFILGLGLESQRLDRIDDLDGETVGTTGGRIVGGIGGLSGSNAHVELVVGYSRGFASADTTFPTSAGDGHYDGLGLELGAYFTPGDHTQFGVTVGYSRQRVAVETGTGSGSGVQQGPDAGVAVGWRF